MQRAPDAAMRAALPESKCDPGDECCIECHHDDQQQDREKKCDEGDNDCAAHKNLRVMTRAADEFGRHLNG